MSNKVSRHISIEKYQDEYLEENHINLSSLVQEKLDEEIKEAPGFDMNDLCSMVMTCDDCNTDNCDEIEKLCESHRELKQKFTGTDNLTEDESGTE